MDDHAVRLRAVTKTYGTKSARVTALAEVSLGFVAGTFTAVMGPSGSGKSTLLQCAAGLDRPDTGAVWAAGVELTTLSETRLSRLRRERIGFVFQSFNLLPTLTAEQNVALPMRLAGRRPGRAVVRLALAQVGLAGRERHRPGELSGGQQQRVAIARALVSAPPVLFADEPTGALDRTTGQAVLRLLRTMVDERRERGAQSLTVIMVTHDPVAAAYADRVVFFADGRPVDELTGPTPESVATRMTGLAAPTC
jgi:putative ABC transport system ATP-binding protein